MKKLILNSDDFGFCHSVNVGVVKGFTEGLLTQASLMVPTPWFEEACTLTKQHNIPVGVHLTATCDFDSYRWRPLTGARSLKNSDGSSFHTSIKDAQEYADPVDLEAEFSAQVELVLARGIRPQYLDAHMGMVNLQVFANTCRRFKLPGLIGPLKTREQEAVMRDLNYKFDSYLWLQEGGDQDWPFYSQPLETKIQLFEKYLQKMPEGVHYNACHLSVDSDEAASMDKNRDNPWTRQIRVTDLEVVCRPELKKLCEKLGIQKANVSEVVKPF